MMYRFFFKRLIDLVISFFALLIMSPIFIVVTIVLAITTHGSPFFIQPRPGKNGRIFKIVKYRTMNNIRNSEGLLLNDAERITRFGGFIRKTSLDELPQLINVLKGDMSLVGPRPLLVEYLPVYNEYQKRRHEVRPGITGWAQVNGRNEISWDQKFSYDIFYIDNYNFKLDIKIVVLTFLNVAKSKGINQSGQVTMERFTNSK